MDLNGSQQNTYPRPDPRPRTKKKVRPKHPLTVGKDSTFAAAFNPRSRPLAWLCRTQPIRLWRTKTTNKNPDQGRHKVGNFKCLRAPAFSPFSTGSLGCLPAGLCGRSLISTHYCSFRLSPNTQRPWASKQRSPRRPPRLSWRYAGARIKFARWTALAWSR